MKMNPSWSKGSIKPGQFDICASQPVVNSVWALWNNVINVNNHSCVWGLSRPTVTDTQHLLKFISWCVHDWLSAWTHFILLTIIRQHQVRSVWAKWDPLWNEHKHIVRDWEIQHNKKSCTYGQVDSHWHKSLVTIAATSKNAQCEIKWVGASNQYTQWWRGY